MRFVIDMNLPPAWSQTLQAAGYDAQHWSEIGAPNAPDEVVLSWARSNGAILFTHDLDFGAILAHSNEVGPSVVQLREPKRRSRSNW
jgi:predicted nuclease of predicted toxin-antitoxin system